MEPQANEQEVYSKADDAILHSSKEAIFIPICKIYKNFKLQFKFTVTARKLAVIASIALEPYHFFSPDYLFGFRRPPSSVHHHFIFDDYSSAAMFNHSITIVIIGKSTRLIYKPFNFEPG